MDFEYLKSTVGDVLAEGLATTFQHHPTDEIDYLAKWLLNYCQVERKKQQAAEQRDNHLKKDQQYEENQRKIKEFQKKAEDNKLSTSQSLDNQLTTLLSLLSQNTTSSSTTLTMTVEQLLQQFSDLLCQRIHASGVYVAKLQSTSSSVNNDHQSIGECLQYIAASSKDKSLLDKYLKRGDGITWDVLQEEAASNEEEGDKSSSSSSKLPPHLFVANTMMGPKSDRIHFFNVPKLGSYLCCLLRFDCCLNDESLDEYCQKIDEWQSIYDQQQQEEEQQRRDDDDQLEQLLRDEEAKEQQRQEYQQQRQEAIDNGDDVPPEPEFNELDDDMKQKLEQYRKRKEQLALESDDDKQSRIKKELEMKKKRYEEFIIQQTRKQPVSYVVCVDTIGQSLRLSDDNQQLALRYSQELQSTLQRIDRYLYQQERDRRRKFIDNNNKILEAEGDDEQQQSSLLTEQQSIEQELRSQQRPSTTQDIQYQYYLRKLLSSPVIRHSISELKTCYRFSGPIQVLLAMMLLIDHVHQQKDVIDSLSIVNWNELRMKINDDLFLKLKDFNPRQQSSSQYHLLKELKQQQKSSSEIQSIIRPERTAAFIQSLINSVDGNSLKESNYALYLVYKYVTSAIELMNRQVVEIKKEIKAKKREEEERRRQEEELRQQQLEEAEAAAAENNENADDDAGADE